VNRRPGERALVRPHVVTGGRAHPTRNIFDLVTLIIAVRGELHELSVEKRLVMQLCRGGALSVAEIAGHLSLPVSVTKVLLSDLVDSGHVTVRASTRETYPRDRKLLEEVLDGLRARL
jgi:hypothetical protein